MVNHLNATRLRGSRRCGALLLRKHIDPRRCPQSDEMTLATLRRTFNDMTAGVAPSTRNVSLCLRYQWTSARGMVYW